MISNSAKRVSEIQKDIGSLPFPRDLQSVTPASHLTIGLIIPNCSTAAQSHEMERGFESAASRGTRGLLGSLPGACHRLESLPRHRTQFPKEAPMSSRLPCLTRSTTMGRGCPAYSGTRLETACYRSVASGSFKTMTPRSICQWPKGKFCSCLPDPT